MGKKKARLTAKELLKKGVPAVLIPGILLAVTLGWKGNILNNSPDYHEIKILFPSSGKVSLVDDGDTFVLQNGVRVRLLGINAPDRGEKNYPEAKDKLTEFIDDETVFLEYDRYQDDKYGRVLSWVWVRCEGKPQFLSEDYMHLTNNISRPGLTDNPKGCSEGKLVNEELVKSGLARYVKYKDRGELKYEKRIATVSKN